MKTILVSGASGIVGYGALKALKSAELNLRLIGTTIYEDSVAQGFCDIFEKAPVTSAPHYLDWLLEVIERHQIDMIIPGIDADLHHWSQNRDAISSAGTKVLLNNPELVGLCKDKWLFYNRLIKKGALYAIPTSLSSDFSLMSQAYGLPLLLKPREGFGSKGIVRVSDEATWDQHKDKIGSILMVQPVVGSDDQEYTTSAYCDGQGGYYACMTLRRELSKDGYTEKAEVIESKQIHEALSVLCAIFCPLGPTNFQFRKTIEGFKLLEINPRISSSTSIRTAFGYNESKMAVEEHLFNILPVQPTIKQGRAVRYIEDKIFFK
ncbi:MAG: ATP-grasp domain-containing protein [Flavobacteriales bacterium]|nr:ATP-grasp domain-containing protein [Flavobacteriales bacterium]